MARYTGPVCRLCRREGMKLFLKGTRCSTEKCAIERRGYAPGQHGKKKGKLTDYGVQLREKQKVKRMYNLLEDQFRSYFYDAARTKGITGEELLTLLERRLDNTVYRMGFATSRREARLLVKHNHILVNNKKVNIPSYLVRTEDIVSVEEKSKKMVVIERALEQAEANGIPAWFEMNKQNFSCKVIAYPKREEITVPIKEQLIVELYSK